MLFSYPIKYIDQYVKGASRISVRSSIPKIDLAQIELRMVNSFGNYDLYFNLDGKLLMSVDLDKKRNIKAIYCYGASGKLVSIIELLLDTNELIEISEFSFDVNGRLSKEIYHTSYDMSNKPSFITKYIHTYKGLKIKTAITTIPADWVHFIYSTFNVQNKKIEEKTIRKAEEDELVFWLKYEYDSNGCLIKEIDLYENGSVDSSIDYYYYPNGLHSGCRYTSKTDNYLTEIQYVFNERGHWINSVSLSDNDPFQFCDRAIEYF
jgi:hypothetical protein